MSANHFTPGNCCGGPCDLSNRLRPADDPDNPRDYLVTEPREIATRLPRNDFYLQFEIPTGGDWDLTLELIDEESNTVIDSAEFRSGQNVPVADFDTNILQTAATATHRATITSSIESTASDIVLRPNRAFAGRLDRTRRSLSFDHDRPHGHNIVPAGPDVTFYPPDSAITVEADERFDAGTMRIRATTSSAATLRVVTLSRSNPNFEIDTESSECFVEPSTINPTCPRAQVTCTSTFTGRHLDATFGVDGTLGDPGFWWGGRSSRYESRCGSTFGAAGGSLWSEIRSFREPTGDARRGSVAWGIGATEPFVADPIAYAGEVVTEVDQVITVDAGLPIVYPLIGGVQLNRDTVGASLRVMIFGGSFVPAVLFGALRPAAGSSSLTIDNGDGSSWIYDRVRADAFAAPGEVRVFFPVSSFTFDLTFENDHAGCLSRPSNAGSQTFSIAEALNFSAYLDAIDFEINNPPGNQVGFWGTSRDDFLVTEALEWRPGDDPPQGANASVEPWREFFVGRRVRRLPIPFNQSMQVTFGDQ
ncbi:MAG: hypothetical protein AAFX06_28780 [Planctomycetota bacterium]